MTIKISVKTRTGSVYEFFSGKDGQMYFRKGIWLSGKVIRLGGKIQVGEPMEVFYYKEGFYGDQEASESWFKTSPVTAITIR